MPKKNIFLSCVFIFFVISKNNVQSAEELRTQRDSVAEGNMQNISAIKGDDAEQKNGFLFPDENSSPVLNARGDFFGDETEKKACDIPLYPNAISLNQEGRIEIPVESVMTVWSGEIYKAARLEADKRSLVRKLIIMGELSEGNKRQLFSMIQRYENIEELILQNCWDLEEIPTSRLRTLPRLRFLALYKIFMDARYVGGYHDAGIKIDNLLEILNIPALTELTLQSGEFKREHIQVLQRCAQEKKISISLLNEWPFRREQW